MSPNSEEAFLEIGQRMHAFAGELYPICRSITGEGTRQTLRAIQSRIGIDIKSLASGTPVFDWEVPNEWNVREAFVEDSTGRRVVDFDDHSLHLLNYSEPVNRVVDLQELKQHMFTLPEQPDLIPYRTSYYKETWGFCVPHSFLDTLSDSSYKVVIDTTLEPGVLNYGELLIPGESEEEVLFSTHVCHPSLANDNLSGIALLTFLADRLRGRSNRYSYRFLFIPGTIGSIAWLSQNEGNVAKIKHGLVVACVGDPGRFHYKKSRQGVADIDRVVEYILRQSGDPFSVREFSPYGYDERQYCSPAFDLPVGSLTRTPHGQFSEYHTSADNMSFITPEALAGSLRCYETVVGVLEGNRVFRNVNPKCEPQLGRRGLYTMMGGYTEAKDDQMAMLWLLNLSDGNSSVLDIALRSGMPFDRLERVASVLSESGLLVDAL